MSASREALNGYLDTKVREWAEGDGRDGVVHFTRRPDPESSAGMYHDPDPWLAHRLDGYRRSIVEDIHAGKLPLSICRSFLLLKRRTAEQLVDSGRFYKYCDSYFWTNIERFAEVVWNIAPIEE